MDLDLWCCYQCDHPRELRAVGGQCPLPLVGFLGLFSLKGTDRLSLTALKAPPAETRYFQLIFWFLNLFFFFSLKAMHSTYHLEQFVKLMIFLCEALIYLISVYIILAFGSTSQSLCRPTSAPPPFSSCFCNQRNCCYFG